MKSVALVAGILGITLMMPLTELRFLHADESLRSDSQKLEYFERFIRPVLVEHCLECHSDQSKSAEGALRLDSRESILTGGASGKAIVLGDPASSLLIKALRYDDLEMPPTQRLSDEVVKHFEQWVADGAVDPRVAALSSGENKPPKPNWLSSEARDFWSLKPILSQPLPSVQQRQWPQTRSDYFVLEQIEEHQLVPSATADRATLVRRLSLDLVGLPAQFAEVERLLADDSPQAMDDWIEQLIASSAFGEHWARMWLDLARYGEDQAHIVGNDRSLCYPNAYKYREWVVEAFNDDLPYDSFVTQQLAADLVPAETADLRPLGFLGLGPKYYNRGTQEVMADEWEDRVDVVTRGFLGLTVACARCHDHKYDPIPTDDYYALAGIFASTAMYNMPLKAEAEKKDNGDAKNPDDALHIVRDAQSKDLHVMIRGDVKRPGEIAPRRFLQSIAPEGSPWPVGAASGRSELAAAIVDPGNPLTARVLVNRVWGRMFGQFLVATPSNFGRLGAAPSHPELLDDLAHRFIASGWSIKWLVREIASSATYQQSSSSGSEQAARDPENKWLSRMNRKRLSVEAWRDSLLSAVGRLDRQIGGPSIDPQNPDVTRRTLYSEISRLEVNKMLSLFDFPDPNAHAERRARTTTSLQKLFVLNSPFMVAQAQYLGERLVREAGVANQPQIRLTVEDAIEQVYGRQATREELTLMVDYVQSLANPEHSQEPGAWIQGWSQLAHVLLASNELAYVD